MGKTNLRPCPRGLYDGCPIPRELCTEDYKKSGEWHCLEFLKDFEQFVFSADEPRNEELEAGEIITLEDLMEVLRQEG